MHDPRMLSVDRKEGYMRLNHPYTQAVAALYSRQGIANVLADGDGVGASDFLRDVNETRFSVAASNWVLFQGFVERRRNLIFSTEEGKDIFSSASEAVEVVSHFTAMKDAVKLERQMENHGSIQNLSELLRDADPTATQEALVTPAISYLSGVPIRNGEHQTAGELLLGGGKLRVTDIVAQINPNRDLFLKVLDNIKVTKSMGSDRIGLTKRGKSLLYKAGGAELILSYYEMLQKLDPLAKGEIKYGFGEDVNRDSELNAHASNGITKIKVAPHIVSELSENTFLKEALGKEGIYIDYGSGGGHMLIQTAADGPKTIKHLRGIDINPAANEEAGKLRDEKGLSDRIKLITGSVADKSILSHFKAEMESLSVTGGVASINAILHDIGPELSAQFLQAHAAILTDVPLIVTETPRVPLEVLMANPNARAPSFDFMHVASGQHLYTVEELAVLLESNGFEIMSKETHASITYEGREYPTAVTWVTRPKAA